MQPKGGTQESPALSASEGIRPNKKEKMKDFTVGRTYPQLINYAIPLILGNFFQLTYNAVDSIILGRYAGKQCLAAVGIANPVMNIMIFLIVGICLGAGIIMSEFYGAKDEKKLKSEISTTIAIGLGFTIVVSALCFIFVCPLLRAIRCPEDLIEHTASYLRVVFAGLVFTFFYNVYASALRAAGDSKSPIVCVAISAVLNGILDYFLVAKLGMEMRGAAFATVASQFISCVLIITYVFKKAPILAVKPKEFKVERSLIMRTVNYSWATALQQCVLYVGKLLIQCAVNPLGVDAIATFNAGTKIDDFCYQPTQSIGHTITTFMAQNRGAKKPERQREGFLKGFSLELIYGVIAMASVFIFRKEIIMLFAGDGEAEVIRLGSEYLMIMSCLYFLPAITNGVQAFFRGTGDVKITVISTTTQIVVRVACSFILAVHYGINGIAFACLAGWIAMLAVELPIFFFAWKKLKKEIKK